MKLLGRLAQSWLNFNQGHHIFLISFVSVKRTVGISTAFTDCQQSVEKAGWMKL